MIQTSSPALQQKLAEIDDLPTLPRVAVQILDLLADPYFSVEALEQVFSRDPALSAKILQIANSAYYSLRFPADSIRRAMLVLGAREIQQVVLSTAVYRTFQTTSGPTSFDRNKFWEHSATSAVIARALMFKLRLLTGRTLPEEAEVAFSAGLLHDLGKIVLDHYFHDDFVCALSLHETERIPLQEAERRILKADHAQVGGWLAEFWKLPLNLITAIQYHHEPELAPHHPLLAICAQFGNLFSRVEGTGFGSTEESVNYYALPSWSLLQQIVPELNQVDIERFTFELEDEFERARQLLLVLCD